MVFFSCDGCGEMLKKKMVDAHARKCYNCESVSCVDCSVSFWGDDYRNHTSCITEAERYEKTVYKGPKKQDTGRKATPQELWTGVIRDALNDCPPSLTAHIQNILGYDNVPRKEKAFRNFASNSLRLYGQEGDMMISSIWKHLAATRERQNQKKEKNQSNDGPPTDDKEQKESQDTKESSDVNNHEEKPESIEEHSNKVEKINNPSSTTSVPKDDKKIVLKAIKKALKKAPKHQMKFKDIRKLMKAQKLLSKNMKKDELNNTIKLAVTEGKKNLRIDGKKVILVDK